MNVSKVYIRGAYGPGNLGDDVLMLCVINILKKRFNESDIAVGVDHPQIAKNFNPRIQWLHIKAPVKADLVVLGGGGQFFSFIPPAKEVTARKGIAAKMYKSIKAQTDLKSTLLRLYVGMRGGVDKIYFHRRLAAFCIGLGPFDGGGKQLDRAVSVINRCDYISVRDGTSQQHCNTFGKSDVEVYTDPSLLSELWISRKDLETGSLKKGKYLSFILRDWPHDANGQQFIKAMVQAADELAKTGEQVRLVSLYKERDQHLIDKYHQYEWLCWDAAGDTPETFMAKLIVESDVIISARAHGVLLPASLGFPTIAVAIENKLKKVHEMLPQGTRLVSTPDPEVIKTTISEFRQSKAHMAEHLKQEIAQRSSLAQKAVDDFLKWVDEQ
ncbi:MULTISPECIES: polysaccharide pyruvyl transferase family protein [unclassified Pseudomonas]|uniref:polysaccharide pyruvyl transferase family protein n=1 Tax=unclassified Pseudomonas TaxID=196821 RepID=UPI0015A02479|nr:MULTISPECIES: polysaccharide pyruvyl transferase family protein [unclassified Pseudomonas]NWC96610.1 polysaccharide pyruvyl transferase family protein [Pseudomonas sp. IPO3779]NWD19313.1 polysaccharide pyruvyl transferase family protein [Pseudomonas sp. IPO3778]